MAKRYDNSFDAEGFVENFRAQDDAPAPQNLPKAQRWKQRKRRYPKELFHLMQLMITKPGLSTI